MKRSFSFVIPGVRAADNPKPRGQRLAGRPWIPDRASRVRNDEGKRLGFYPRDLAFYARKPGVEAIHSAAREGHTVNQQSHALLQPGYIISDMIELSLKPSEQAVNLSKGRNQERRVFLPGASGYQRLEKSQCP